MTAVNGQTLLSANGEGQTYEEINAVLAPGYNVVEVPDCAHPEFGRHIKEIFDEDLNTHVFQFIAHVSPDNDRCKKFDRQRTEIKTYGNSPDSLKAFYGETVEYQWLFKVPRNFKVSKSFTHLHQIKSVGGLYASTPMVTLTARKGNQYDKLELRMTPKNNQTTKTTADLSLIKGRWISAREIIHFEENGSYFIQLKDHFKDRVILEYNVQSIDTWQDGALFARPKWGIYRSLKQAEDLSDEEVFFNHFSIEKVKPISVDTLETIADKTIVYLNDGSNMLVSFKKYKTKSHDKMVLYNSASIKIPLDKMKTKKEIDFSKLTDGLYYLSFFENQELKKVVKFMVLN